MWTFLIGINKWIFKLKILLYVYVRPHDETPPLMIDKHLKKKWLLQLKLKRYSCALLWQWKTWNRMIILLFRPTWEEGTIYSNGFFCFVNFRLWIYLSLRVASEIIRKPVQRRIRYQKDFLIFFTGSYRGLHFYE